MFPMDMEEFLIAMGQDDIVRRIKECFASDSPMPSVLHDLTMKYYRQYLVVGGMPECVFHFAETSDYILVRNIQTTILTNYLDDMSKYNKENEIVAQGVIYMSDELEYFKGGMAENYINVHLMINGYTTYYWESDRGAEIDFVIQRDIEIIPVEVKSADNTQAKSLKVYIESFKPKYAIKLSTRNFGFENGKKTVPLYAAFCI